MREMGKENGGEKELRNNERKGEGWERGGGEERERGLLIEETIILRGTLSLCILDP